jgi:hypothetical protein
MKLPPIDQFITKSFMNRHTYGVVHDRTSKELGNKIGIAMGELAIQ